MIKIVIEKMTNILNHFGEKFDQQKEDSLTEPAN